MMSTTPRSASRALESHTMRAELMRARRAGAREGCCVSAIDRTSMSYGPEALACPIEKPLHAVSVMAALP